jgi:formate/nitrite transporter FocA (FNT family)
VAFAIGFSFVTIARSELFVENFLDPVAAAVAYPRGHGWADVGRLWSTTLLLNLLGGGLVIAVATVDGVLPVGTAEALIDVADDIAARSALTTAARAVFAGR